MSRYNPEYPPHPSPADDAGSFHPGLKTDRHDETASPSGSDDGSHYTSYTDMQKNELDGEEDPTALTSQTLNADGTPKRPMNAFMIFARRRRPQVSAENQSMRTGEISKILSKEWTSMQPSDKQFFLDQAKQLKETFNTKYPDYVYRRRPNNSRKRRRTDGSIRGTDNPIPTDMRDEILGTGDPGESSPTDGEDSQVDSLADADFSRPPHGLSHGYNEHTKLGSSHSRVSPYPYTPSDLPYRSSGVSLAFYITSLHPGTR
ncbi:high mobility group box domain-containing protein [Infundibulicybe gibba]|nr:high mobility group box domain-containing protein [Infundibulicybe gibba]